jgi:hypothetical protein
MKIRVLPIAFILVAFGAGAQSSPAPREDSAVLSAVTHKLCDLAKANSASGYDVLPNTNEGATSDIWPGPGSLDQYAAHSLAKRNSTTHSLPSMYLCTSIRLVPAAWLHDFRGWAWFHAAFPGSASVLRLSLPGYSRNGNVAVVLVSTTSGPLASGGNYWILQKVHGKWVVVKQLLAWVS